MLARHCSLPEFEQQVLLVLQEIKNKQQESTFAKLVSLLASQKLLSENLLSNFFATATFFTHPKSEHQRAVMTLIEQANAQKIKIASGDKIKSMFANDHTIQLWAMIFENDFLTQNQTPQQYLVKLTDDQLVTLFDVYPERWQPTQEIILEELAKDQPRLQAVLQKIFPLQTQATGKREITRLIHSNGYKLLDKLPPQEALKILEPFAEQDTTKQSVPVSCLLAFWQANLYAKMAQPERALVIFNEALPVLHELNPIIAGSILLNAQLPLLLRREFARLRNPLESRRALNQGLELACQADDNELMSYYLPTFLSEIKGTTAYSFPFFPTRPRTTQIFFARLRDAAAAAATSPTAQQGWERLTSRLFRAFADGQNSWSQYLATVPASEKTFIKQILQQTFLRNVAQEDDSIAGTDSIWNGCDYAFLTSISDPAFLKELKRVTMPRFQPFYTCLLTHFYYQNKKSQ